MSEITVIMTAYNGEKYILEQVNSILKSSFQNFSLHIYDDGSTDSTREILKELEAKHPEKIRFFPNEKNKGVIRNFMEGALDARSPYIMFSDQDDVWLADKLSKSLKKIKEQEVFFGADIPITVFTDTKVVDGKLSEIAPSFHGSSHLNPEKTDLSHLLMENKLIGCTMIINRAMQEKLRYIPKGIRMHDWWIGLIGSALGKVAYLPEATLLYRQHEKNVIGSKSFLGYVKNRLSSLKKQKKVLRKTEEQAAAFLRVFGKELSKKDKKTVEDFTALLTAGFFRKRYLLIKNGFWKTGILRNIGLILLI